MPNVEDTPESRRPRSYLDERTFRARRALLLTCSIAAAYVLGLFPSGLVVLGVEFRDLDESKVSVVLVVVIIYLLAEFMILARSDYIQDLLKRQRELDSTALKKSGRDWDFIDLRVPSMNLPRRGWGDPKERAARFMKGMRALRTPLAGKAAVRLPYTARVLFPLPRYGAQACLDWWLPVTYAVLVLILLLYSGSPPDAFNPNIGT